jgi:hypothetical protein
MQLCVSHDYSDGNSRIARLVYDSCKTKPVTGVITGLIQGRTGIFAEWMQGRHLYVLRYSVSVFGNLVSMLIVTLGLLGYSNGYQTTVAMIRNSLTLVKLSSL